MEIVGLNKIVDALGNAFSVFDFSFFISGALTLGFIALDLHYYGHDGILQLQGWTSVLIYILAIYVCGLMSWSVGKLMRWGLLRLIWGKDGVRKDFEKVYNDTQNCNTNGQQDATQVTTGNESSRVNYTKMWIEIEKKPELASKLSSLNKMWVMVAVFEGLACSWMVGILVYLDGWLVGEWLINESISLKLVSLLVLIVMIAVCLHRATCYSRDLIKEVVVTYKSLN